MLYSVQALRAFAAWLVVFHHVMQVFFDFKAESASGWFLAERGAIGVGRIGIEYFDIGPDRHVMP